MAKRARAVADDPATQAVDSGIILQLDPNTILADDNPRYNLKDSRIQTLADSIVSQGGVIEPVEVEPIPEPQNGFLYKLILGNYRHAAVKFLNTTMAAGLTLPAVVHITKDPIEKLRRQLAENVERENMSPMDQATAIQRLLNAGIPRIEIRQIFSRPGGRKGSKVQPASNSFINMTRSFLDLPKPTQEKIHQGLVGVAAAYQLTKVDPDKRAAVMLKLEAERAKELEREEKDEERFLTSEKKREEQQTKLAEAQANLEATEKKAKDTADTLERQTDLTAELFKTSKGKHNTPKDKKAADNAFKEAEKQRVVAEADANEAQKEYEKAQVAHGKLADVLVPAKKAEKKQKAVSAQAVQKAAKEAGQVGAVILNAIEMRRVITDMGLPAGDKEDDKMKLLSDAFTACFAGITTPEQLYREVRKLLK